MSNQSTPLNESQVKKFIPGIIWFFLVLLLICLPASVIPPEVSLLNVTYFDKWIHASLFTVLSFLFIYPVAKLPIANKAKKSTAIKIVISVCIWGLATEFIQKYFIPDRSFDIFDWLADSFGGVIAYLWCRLKYLN